MSLNRWIRRLPRQLVEDHLHLTEAELAQMPDGMRPMLP